jgi:hypothetical protein
VFLAPHAYRAGPRLPVLCTPSDRRRGAPGTAEGPDSSAEGLRRARHQLARASPLPHAPGTRMSPTDQPNHSRIDRLTHTTAGQLRERGRGALPQRAGARAAISAGPVTLVAPSQPASATASAGRRQRSSPRRCPGCLPRGRASRANRWPATCRRGHRPVAGKRSANRLHTCAAPGTTSSVNHSADWIGWEAVVCGADGDGRTAWDYLDVAHSQQADRREPGVRQPDRARAEPTRDGEGGSPRGSTRPRPWEDDRRRRSDAQGHPAGQPPTGAPRQVRL